MPETLAQKALAFAILREQKEEYEHIITLLNTELTKMGEELFETFIAENIANFRINGRDIFKDGQDRVISPDVKFKGTVANEGAFFEYLRTQGHGSMIREYVHPATLESWIKRQKEENSELPDDSILKIWSLSTAKIRRASKSAKPKGGVQS